MATMKAWRNFRFNFRVFNGVGFLKHRAEGDPEAF